MMIKTRICWRRMTMAVLTCMGWCRLVWGGRWRCLSCSGWWPPGAARHHQSAHRPAAHRQCCKHQSTHRHTDTPTVLLSQQDKKAKSIQDRQIPKRQYNKFTLYQCFKTISGTKDTHNVFFSKRRFSTNIKVSRKWGIAWSFLSKLSVLLWKSWKMKHQYT